MVKCARKGCFETGLSVKDLYTTDRLGGETGLTTTHKTVGTAANENFHGCVYSFVR